MSSGKGGQRPARLVTDSTRRTGTSPRRGMQAWNSSAFTKLSPAANISNAALISSFDHATSAAGTVTADQGLQGRIRMQMGRHCTSNNVVHLFITVPCLLHPLHHSRCFRMVVGVVKTCLSTTRGVRPHVWMVVCCSYLDVLVQDAEGLLAVFVVDLHSLVLRVAVSLQLIDLMFYVRRPRC